MIEVAGGTAAREGATLAPVRHVYGAAEGSPPAPGDPAYAEYVLLKDTREVLDALPHRRPDASALEAVRAAVAAHALGPVRAAYGEAAPPAPDDARHAEYAVIRGAKEALDQLPKVRPDAAALDAVTAEGRGGVPHYGLDLVDRRGSGGRQRSCTAASGGRAADCSRPTGGATRASPYSGVGGDGGCGRHRRHGGDLEAERAAR